MNESKAEKGGVAEKVKNMGGEKPPKGLTGGYSLKKEIPEGMKTPKAPEDSNKQMAGKADHMGHSGMSHAVKHLNRETERGEHVASVGGHKMPGHSGKMPKG